MGSKIMNCFKQ